MIDVVLCVGIRDLGTVYFATSDVSGWIFLGLALGLYHPTLEKIEGQSRNIDDCRRQMLASWLEQKDDVVEKALPTWKALESALRKIEQNALASKISEKYC